MKQKVEKILKEGRKIKDDFGADWFVLNGEIASEYMYNQGRYEVFRKI